jgi:hypothetical protein
MHADRRNNTIVIPSEMSPVREANLGPKEAA